jgi:hypothetical protein
LSFCLVLYSPLTLYFLPFFRAILARFAWPFSLFAIPCSFFIAPLYF